MINVGDLLLYVSPPRPQGWTLLGDNLYWKRAEEIDTLTWHPVMSLSLKDASGELRKQLEVAGLESGTTVHLVR